MTDRLSRHLQAPGGNAAATRRMSRSTEPLQGAVRQALQQAGELVAAHPLACLSAAAVAGIVLGWWVKRK